MRIWSGNCANGIERYRGGVDFVFARTHHDRSAHARAGDNWVDPSIRVMVLGGEHIATECGGNIRWMSQAQAPDGEWIFLGHIGSQSYAAVLIDWVPQELEPASLRVLGPSLSDEDASLAVHAVGIARWHGKHRFCPVCGAPTRSVEAGHQRHCDSCGTEHFPRTDPAVIMLITDEHGRALLGRQSAWPQGRYSTLAGFVEPGENLSDAVRREVREEVGIGVDDVQYAGSQPWPFPASLMLGFFGRTTDTELQIDGDEIIEAHWFTRDEITELSANGSLKLPSAVSISRALIETWHGGNITGQW